MWGAFMTYDMPIDKVRRTPRRVPEKFVPAQKSVNMPRVNSRAQRVPSFEKAPVKVSANTRIRARRDIKPAAAAAVAGEALVALRNAAVNLPKFAENALVNSPNEDENMKSKEKKPFPVSFIFTAVLFTLLIMFMILNYVMLNDYSIDVANLNDQLNELVQNEKELSLELTKKEDISSIEDIAKNEFGMVKSEKVTRKYISLEGADKTEILSDKSNDKNYPIFTAMSAIGNALSDILAYMK